jgi:hypothetical protein
MSTTDKLRFEIDSHRTGDKVAASDPAAAPLGTDEEAAGTPPDAEAVEWARAHELKAPGSSRQRGGAVGVYLALIFAVLCAIVGGAAYLLATSP